MKISPKVKRYKKAVDSLNAKELLAALNNSRLTADERFALELVDVYQIGWKQAAEKMNTDEAQLGKWLKRGREKVLKRIFK